MYCILYSGITIVVKNISFYNDEKIVVGRFWLSIKESGIIKWRLGNFLFIYLNDKVSHERSTYSGLRISGMASDTDGLPTFSSVLKLQFCRNPRSDRGPSDL